MIEQPYLLGIAMAAAFGLGLGISLGFQLQPVTKALKLLREQ